MKCFEAGSSRGTLQRRICYFKEAKPWLWHVEVILGVNVVALVTHEQLCKVVWGIIIKNFTQRDRQTDRNTERDRERQRQREHKHRSLWVCWSAHRSVCAGNEREIQTGNWRIFWLAGEGSAGERGVKLSNLGVWAKRRWDRICLLLGHLVYSLYNHWILHRL